MPHWRAYIRKKIVQHEDYAEGGDFSRIIDLQVEGSPKAEIDRMLEKDEEIDQLVTITLNPDDDLAEASHYGSLGDILSG
jgi:hypothetical protein